MWYSSDANVRLHAEPAFGIVPGIPSLIVTANRVDQFLSNTGSFSGSFTGSLFGTASWSTNALTASRAISASYAPIFPYVGTATITGSLIVSSSTTQLIGPSHTVRASTGDINLFATASSVNTQTQRFRIYDPLSTVGVSDHIYVEANTADGGMYWSSNDEVIANYNTLNGRYGYGNNNLYVSSSDNRTYSPSGFVGSLIGTASWATNVLTASAATTVDVNDVPSNNATNYLSFFLANSGFRPSRVASTKFIVNPATGSMGINKSTITTGYNLDVNGSVLISGSALITGSLNVTGSTILNNGQTTIRGAGATSATTTLLVQNSTPTTLFRIQDHGQVAFTSPTMSLAASQSAFSISPIISASNIVGGQYYGVSITPTFFKTTGSQTETAFRVAATFTQSSAVATSGTNIIADFGSTSAGSQLTVTDVTSGSIYMVNDVSGIPIIEATSNWDVNIYDFPNKIFEKTGSQVNIYGTMRVSGSFILPLSQSVAPQTGSAYWSGSFLFIYDGTRYRSSSFA
jgi:hypothetical protein